MVEPSASQSVKENAEQANQGEVKEATKDAAKPDSSTKDSPQKSADAEKEA